MKTQTEIEKEIEILKNEINNRNRSKKEISDRFKISHADRKINLLKALLQQNKEFIEMIEKLIIEHEGLYFATKFDFNVSVTHQNFCIELKEFEQQLKKLGEGKC